MTLPDLTADSPFHKVAAVVEALMEDDPANFKRGYTLDAALLAVKNVYGVKQETLDLVRSTMERHDRTRQSREESPA